MKKIWNGVKNLLFRKQAQVTASSPITNTDPVISVYEVPVTKQAKAKVVSGEPTMGAFGMAYAMPRARRHYGHGRA